MLLSAVSALVVAQLSSEIPEGLMNNPVYEQYINTFRQNVEFLNVTDSNDWDLKG